MADDQQKPNLLGLESVQSAFRAAGEIAANAARQSVIGDAQYFAEEGIFGSPIEAIFYAYFRAVTAQAGGDLDLHPQVSIHVAGAPLYRADFIISAAAADADYEAYLYKAGHLQFIVELDGHDFHEKTKEQVTYRNQRDRDLQSGGWKVLHYSGSELIRNPLAAAMDAYNKAHTEWMEILARLRSAKAPHLAELERTRG